MITWRKQSADLHEARVTTADGRELYAGYVARTPPSALWRGYVGARHLPVGLGSLSVVRAAVEQIVVEILERHPAGGAGMDQIP